MFHSSTLSARFLASTLLPFVEALHFNSVCEIEGIRKDIRSDRKQKENKYVQRTGYCMSNKRETRGKQN